VPAVGGQFLGGVQHQLHERLHALPEESGGEAD
jgi:hypothetical protein